MRKKPLLIESVDQKIRTAIRRLYAEEYRYPKLFSDALRLLVLRELEFDPLTVGAVVLYVYISVNEMVGYKNSGIALALIKFERLPRVNARAFADRIGVQMCFVNVSLTHICISPLFFIFEAVLDLLGEI